MSATITVTHIDTCLPCYLTDHHGRDNECLIGVAIDGSTTYAQVLDYLLDELNAYGPDWEEDCELAIREQFSTVPDMGAPFDASLETIGEDEDLGDMVQAYFLLERHGEDAA